MDIKTFLCKNPDIFWYMKKDIIPTIPWFYYIRKSIAYTDLKQMIFNNNSKEIIYELKNMLEYNMIDKIEIDVDRFCYDEWFDEFDIIPKNKIIWVFEN